jgi:hypothetical protein
VEHQPSASIELLRHRSERSRAQLKQTIGEFSQSLSDTTDELKTTLSPQHLKQEARAYANKKQASLVQAVREKVTNHPLEALAIGAVAAYPLLGVFRRIPMPLALIGAGLLMSRNRNKSAGEEPPHIRRPENGGETAGKEGLRERLHSGLEDAQEQVASVGAKTAETVADMTASAVSGVQATTQDIAARAVKVSAGSRDALASLIDRNPLVAGGVAMAIGGFIAASIPASRIEERVLGKGSEVLKGTARTAADAVVRGAKAEAAKVADNVSEAARETGLTPEALDETVDALADKVASVVDRGVDAAIGAKPRKPVSERTIDGDDNATL